MSKILYICLYSKMFLYLLKVQDEGFLKKFNIAKK